MGRSPKKCIICHVQTDTDTLNQYGGRCKSCAMAKAATDKGMTYGKMQGMIYAEQQAKIAEKERFVGMYDGKRKKVNNCRKCGGYIPDGAKYEGFCCRECKSAYEKQQMEAIERGAIPDPEKETAAEPEPAQEEIIPPKKPEKYTNCVNCGGALRGKQTKYCSVECQYQYNREKQTEYMRQYQDARRPDSMKRANLRCRICGYPITAKGRRTLCSKECEKKAKASYKQAGA